MILYYLEQFFWLIVAAVLLLAVLWETEHLIEWFRLLSQEGTAPRLLRQHAYNYATWFFGTDFGWHC